MGKITSYRILIKRKRNKHILIWRHVWWCFLKNSYAKKTTKRLLFSILRRNLSKFVTQTGLYCSKQLETTFLSILWKIVTFKFFSHTARSKPSMYHSRALRACLAPLPRDWTHQSDQPRHTWFQIVGSDLAPLNIGLATAYRQRRIVKPGARSQ